MDEHDKKTKRETSDKAEEYLNGWKRAQADLINYKKDEAKRIEEIIKFGNEKLILQMIDVLDGLERALQHAPPNTDAGWLKGMEQAINQFSDVMHKNDIKKIESVGTAFDPLLHEAVQVEEGDGEQKVTEEFRSGYTLYGKVIRPARVKISN